MRKFLLAWVASFAAMFLLAGLFNGVLVRDFVAANIRAEILRSPSNITFILLGYAALALLMSLIYPRVVAVTSVRSGVVFGVIAGICWLLPYGLVLHGVYQFPTVALFIDPAWALVEQGVGGAIIGLVHSKL